MMSCMFVCAPRWERHPRLDAIITRSRWLSSHQKQHQEKIWTPENTKINGRPQCENVQSLCEEGHLDRALELLDQHGSMLSKGVYWSLLKLCNKNKALHHAKHVHAHMAVHSLQPITSLNEYLVVTLVKCGDLEAALQVFDMLPHRTVFSWTAVISGFIDNGKGEVALQLYQYMLEEGVQPNEYTYVCLFKACGSIPNLKMGKALHAHAWRDGLHTHVVIRSTIVSMYAKCGSVTDAEKVFLGLPQHDVVSCTTMLSAYVEHGQEQKAIHLYKRMQEEGVNPNEWTFAVALKGCCALAEKEEALVVEGESVNMMPLDIGRMLHADAWWKGLDSQVFVGNSLVRMYGKCGSTLEAENVFNLLSNHNVVSWTALLSLYIEQGEVEKALKLYRQMQEDGATPDERTFLIILQACCTFAAIEKVVLEEVQSMRVISFEIGQALHADARRKGFDSDVFVGNTLVDLYAKCGKFVEAGDVFAVLSQHDVVSWTVMLSAYVEQGQAEKALQLYQQMQEEGVSPDEWTYVNALKACCKLAEKEEFPVREGQSIKQMPLEIGKALHSDALEKGFDSDIYFCSILVSMYGKCGSILEAEYAFYGLTQHDMISFIVMLSTYTEQGQGEKALQLYRQMQEKYATIDDTTHGYVLQTCSDMGSVEICRLIHHSILWTRNDLSLLLATRLIYAYGSCASAADAQAVFDSLSTPDVVSWNALMAGYVRGGNSIETLIKFEEMQMADVIPSAVTFLSLLAACCQTGLVDKGVKYFESMSRDHGLNPCIQHYGSMVDLLGRAGDFTRVEDMFSRMPMQPDLAMWLGLLGACRVYGHVELGKQSFDQAVHLQPKQAAAYVLMSNIYVDAGMQDCANEVDNVRQKASAWKKPGESWIVLDKQAHSFVVGDSNNLGEEHLYDVLQQISVVLRQRGHIPHTEYYLS